MKSAATFGSARLSSPPLPPGEGWGEGSHADAQGTALADWLVRQDYPGIHARDAAGDTPMMRAAALGDDAIVEALLQHGAAADALNDRGNNALWFACKRGRLRTVQRLLDAGVPVEHSNDDDLSCAMQAAACGRHAVLRLLLAHGADAGRCAPDGRSVLDIAAHQRRQQGRERRQPCPDQAPPQPRPRNGIAPGRVRRGATGQAPCHG